MPYGPMDHGSICLRLIIGFRCGPKPHETMDSSCEQATMQAAAAAAGGGTIMIKGKMN